VATDHGTHVASLIGGRKDSCWSGLLPQSRLVHIDVTDQALTRTQVSNARRSRTKVFNVSQQLGADSPQDDAITFLDNLRNWMVVEFKDVLFVAAAGNSGRNLNNPIGVGYPAGFGESENVVTVTALGSGHDVLGTHETDGVTQRGVNFGKRVVDLAAPGTKIVAATGQQMFGSATGTSQAAPAVAAAAAFVIDAAEIDVGDAKARLIAAAKWYPDLIDDVWGGEFSFGDTVLLPTRDVLQTSTGDDRIFAVAGAKKDAIISIDNMPTVYTRGGGAAGEAATQLPFDNILSLRLDPESDTYRIVYKDPASNHLVITLGAQVSGTLECEQLMLLDVATEALTAVPDSCAEPIQITQVTKFIRHLPYHVEW
jgi:subtilisin family serine protease